MSTQRDYDWSDLAFASKKPVSSLKATFIAASRELSSARCKQLIKDYLPLGNIIIGIAKEPYISGFDNQPHFKTLSQKTLQPLVDKVNTARSPHNITLLHYAQTDLKHILPKLRCKQAIFVRGSYLHTFHTTEVFYTLINNTIPYQLVSPFVDETEAKTYARKMTARIEALQPKLSNDLSERQVLELCAQVAARSYDYSFQTGAVLVKPHKNNYRVLTSAHNVIVPYETYAMHHGAAREVHFSPPHDLNHYDTVHAEVNIVLQAAKQKIDTKDTHLFVNLMPCPPCARMLCQTDIATIHYAHDHSDGYAVKMFELAGKKVKRTILQ